MASVVTPLTVDIVGLLAAFSVWTASFSLLLRSQIPSVGAPRMPLRPVGSPGITGAMKNGRFSFSRLSPLFASQHHEIIVLARLARPAEIGRAGAQEAMVDAIPFEVHELAAWRV
jgi:hypothetical protein